jgi:hypothetical protein
MSSPHSVGCHTLVWINAGRGKSIRRLIGMLLSVLSHLTSHWSCLSVSALPKGSGGRCATLRVHSSYYTIGLPTLRPPSHTSV